MDVLEIEFHKGVLHLNGRPAGDWVQEVYRLREENFRLAAGQCTSASADEGGRPRLRELGGALPDENITAMTERVIAERNALRKALRLAREGYASEAATCLPVLPQWRERTMALIDEALKD